MYPSYKEGLTIDRIDSNGNYEKANCRWASREIQQRNKRLIQVNNTSGYKGVCLHKPSGKFQSLITVNRKLIYLKIHNPKNDPIQMDKQTQNLKKSPERLFVLL